MFIRQLDLTHFRQFNHLKINPAPHINIIYGNNGSGKTSLLESIYWLSHGRSFRQVRGMQLIQDDEEMATVYASFHDGQDRSIGWQKKKHGSSSWRLDRQPVTSFAPIAKSLPVQWLDTSSHRDYASGPKERRRFFDWGLFHVEPEFHGVWSSYQTAVSQRNAALKQKQWLGQWDHQCVHWGERLDAMRRSYFECYSQVFEQYVASLSLVDLSVSLRYERGWSDSDSLAEALASSLGQDQRMGFTSCGPHRADVVITTPKGAAHQRLSQGQQKMLAYAWRLAQGEMLQSKRGSHGIILIDDLTAELDPQKRSNVLRLLAEHSWQCFIAVVHLDEVAPFLPKGLDFSAMKIGS